mmetsp:Transcript_7246/g.12385  ORF Transcript_7246/g.12385 Transcript_7246/m.12385 type:complete len:164 (+) Transcript_7246:93-584(+)
MSTAFVAGFVPSVVSSSFAGRKIPHRVSSSCAALRFEVVAESKDPKYSMDVLGIDFDKEEHEKAIEGTMHPLSSESLHTKDIKKKVHDMERFSEYHESSSAAATSAEESKPSMVELAGKWISDSIKWAFRDHQDDYPNTGSPSGFPERGMKQKDVKKKLKKMW